MILIGRSVDKFKRGSGGFGFLGFRFGAVRV